MPQRTNKRNNFLPYAGLRLKRTSPIRDHADWQSACRDQPKARVLPVWRGRNLVSGWDGQRLGPASRPDLSVRTMPLNDIDATELVLLGVDEETPILAADLSHWSKPQARALTHDADFIDLRLIGPALEAQDAALLSYARGMVHWHQTHRHCGRCGTDMANQKGGMLRKCNNDDCGGTAFPRIDPAIIVLVEDRELHADGIPKCLLGRAPGWPQGVYSTLAGFVEPGESLEETVAREVREESGIGVNNVRYHASQPWPFPSSLMLGFHATARTLEITTHDDELEDAQWFTADEVRNAGDWGDDEELCLPRHDSIARHLIETWLDAV